MSSQLIKTPVARVEVIAHVALFAQQEGTLHYLHIIAVEADDGEDAISIAEEAISHYGDGDVWDWYEVGGRWDGYFHTTEEVPSITSIGGSNVVSFKEHPEVFRKSVAAMSTRQDRNFKDAMDKILGRKVTVEDVADHALGIPITDKESAAQRISDDNLEFGQCWESLKNLEELPRDNPITTFGSFGMLGFYLKKLGSLLSGNYTTDSYFFDSVQCTASPFYVIRRCEEAPERQWLVAVDLHN